MVVRQVEAPHVLGWTLPDRIVTISDCIADDLPRPEFWDWFQDRGEAVRRRDAEAPDAQVVAVALTPMDADDLMSSHGGPDQPWFEVLRQRRHLAIDATVLGFEVVGAESTLDFHSWHCHGYVSEASAALGISTNDVGLLSTEADARLVLDWMLNLPNEKAPEPVDWTIVALAEAGC
jgi:hypothetical protein